MPIAVTEVRRVRLSPVLYWIAVTSALVLFAIGLRMILDHAGAAEAYGVSVSGIADEAYMSAAGVRNLFVGGVLLVFTLLRDRRALGVCALFGTVISIGDGLNVLRHSSTPLQFVLVHWVTGAASLVMAYFLLRREPKPGSVL
jgi:hypothetical protein